MNRANGGHTGTNTINDIPFVGETSITSSRSNSNNSDSRSNIDPTRSVVETSSSSSSVGPPTALADRPPRSDFLVSEHEDNDEQDLPDEVEESGSTIIVDEANDDVRNNNTNGNNMEATATNTTTAQPTEIPPEGDEIPNESTVDNDDDESDYEYDYEDNDDGQYSGFLTTQPVFGHPRNNNNATIVPQDTIHPHPIHQLRDPNNNVVELDDADDESTSPETQFKPQQHPSTSLTVARASLPPPPSSTATANRPKSKWKDPSREAISMSLRAENETTGGRRRLAADLYKIMTHDNQEAGFSIAPRGEDRMDAWTIRLFKFDEDSNLHRDLRILGLDHVELEMNFPGQYPFEPPFVRVVRPRFKRQTGFVMNGALCMELLTNEGWNPINDIESVIVSIRSLLVVGDGRLQAVVDMSQQKQEALQEAASRRDEKEQLSEGKGCSGGKRKREDDGDGDGDGDDADKGKISLKKDDANGSLDAGQYTTAEAKAAYSHLSNFHKKKGWSPYWAKKG